MLRPKGFYKDFDADCFQAYIDYALTEDPYPGGVELTIPKMDEVAKSLEPIRRYGGCLRQNQKFRASGRCREGPFLARKFPAASAKEVWHSFYRGGWWTYVSIGATCQVAGLR